MFQGECTINLNNLFSKPSTPILSWTNPRQSFLRNYDHTSHLTYDHTSHLTYDNSSVSVRFHFLDLHLPSSASVWFDSSTMLTCSVWMWMFLCDHTLLCHACIAFFIVLYIYGFFLALHVLAYPRQYILPCTNRYILNSLVIVLTSNELQPHSRSLLAHSVANINVNIVKNRISFGAFI